MKRQSGMVRKMGGNAVFIQCDVSRVAEVKAVVDKIVEIYGRLDYAFNNAGIQVGPIPIVDYPEESLNKIIGVNLIGVRLCMKHEIPKMLKQGKGSIVNTSSTAGLVGIPGASAYAAAKHGVIGITRTVALEYAKAGIRANVICPGVIDTPLASRLGQIARTL